MVLTARLALTPQQRAIVAQLPSWPALRDGAWTRRFLQPVIDALLAGDRGPALAFVATGPCRQVSPPRR